MRALGALLAVLWLLALSVPAAADDFFSSDDETGGGSKACTDKCVADFADGVWGDPPCANFGLERCVHQCRVT